MTSPRARYQRPRCTTSAKGRRLGFLIGVSGRSAGVAEGYQQGPVAVLREAEQLAGELDVGDARMAAAYAQVGGPGSLPRKQPGPR